MTLEKLSAVRCFDGIQERYSHWSSVNKCKMTFSIYLPPNVIQKKESAPCVLWLSGLTCNDENFVQKAGAQQLASKLGIIVITPDTSPRGEAVPDDPNCDWDFGLGAGFYVNASEAPWSTNYNMFDYVNHELHDIIQTHFPCTGKMSVFGHSMGGHGALISAMHFPDKYQSVSAFAPIVNPIQCPWGKKAFSNYLGENKKQWLEFDCCELLANRGLKIPGMIDQGDADNFLAEQLKTQNLEAALNNVDADLSINYRPGYDHSYFFIASFIDKHLEFHAKFLVE